MLLIQVHQHLGVSPGAEPMSFGDQLLIEAGVIVELAIEYDHNGAVLVGDGLVPAGQVHDAEPAHAEANPALDERAPVVGTPMSDRVAHPEDLRLIDRS